MIGAKTMVKRRASLKLKRFWVALKKRAFSFWGGVGIGNALGILVTLAVAMYQTRTPSLTVTCKPGADGNPVALNCEMQNNGSGEARDVLVSFNTMLPVATRVFAAPEVGAQIVEAESPPDPTAGPSEASLRMAFSVRLPRVTQKRAIRFQVRTTDSDNTRAAAQVMRIRREIAGVLGSFGARIKAKYPVIGERWNTDLILSTRIKEESFFRPAKVSYESGTQDIEFLTADERIAQAHCQDLYSRYHNEFIEVFQGKPRYVAPVVKVKTSEGDRTYAIFPPYVSSGLLMEIEVDQLKRDRRLTMYPPVPDSYDKPPLPFTPEHQDPFTDGGESVKHSVFPVICILPDKKGGAEANFQQTGTGFFVSSAGRFVTTGRALNELKKTASTGPLKGCLAAIYIPLGGWRENTKVQDAKWIPIKDCVSDRTSDVALCTPNVDPPGEITPATIVVNEPPRGTPIAFTGIAAADFKPSTTSGILLGYTNAGESMGVKITNAYWPGASGSPIYLQDGRVIGVVTGKRSENATVVTVGSAGRTILSFLARHKVNALTRTPKKN